MHTHTHSKTAVTKDGNCGLSKELLLTLYYTVDKYDFYKNSTQWQIGYINFIKDTEYQILSF